MTLTAYRRACRKVQAAHDALKTGIATAEYFDKVKLRDAILSMQAGLDAMRVQVCKDCNRHGSWEMPSQPGTFLSCHHPDVPQHDLSATSAGVAA